MSENDKRSENDTPIVSERPSNFINDVLKLLSGTTIASLILLFSAPILTRYYGPEAFGFFALFTSLSSLFIVIACFKYELSIILPESDEMAANLLALCFLINTILSIFLFFFIGLFAKEIATFLNIQTFERYLWLIPVMVFLNGLYEALNYWNTRKKQFHRLAITKVANAGITTATQIGAGYGGYATGGSLIGANIVGSLASVSILGGQIFYEDKVFIKRSLNWERIVEGFKRYRNFPLYSSTASFISTLSWQLPVLLLSVYFSPIVIGFYALGFRVLQFPSYLLGSSLSQVFFQRAVEANKENKLGALVEDIFKILVSINLFPILILTFVGGDLFSFIFGPTWNEAGVYIQILSIWAFIWILTSPLDVIFSVLEKQAYDFKINILILTTRFFSLIIGGLLGNVYIALFLFAGTGIIVYSVLLERILTFSHVNYYHILKILVNHLLLFLPMGIILLLLIILNANSFTIFVVVILGLFGYYTFILNREPQLKSVLNQIKNKLSK
jgi:lipopolysaccharide exporter